VRDVTAKMEWRIHNYTIFYTYVVYAYYIYTFFLSVGVTFERGHFLRLTKDEKSFNAPLWYQSARAFSRQCRYLQRPLKQSEPRVTRPWRRTSISVWLKYLLKLLSDGRGSFHVKFDMTDSIRRYLNKWLVICLSFFLQKNTTSKSLHTTANRVGWIT